MLTLPAALTAALARGRIDPVVYVKIEKASLTIEAVTRPWLDYTPGIAEISPFAAELEPMDRKSRVGNLTITANNDGWFYGLAIANQLRGARVTVLWGDISAEDTDDLAQMFMGTIESVATDAVNKVVGLSCADYLATLRDRNIVGRFLNIHPLEVISQILLEIDGGLGFSGAAIDDESLDPENHPDIQHWVVSRGTVSLLYKDTSLTTPTSAKVLIDELATLMDGQLVCLEDGVLKFQRYLAGQDVVDDWTDSDFIDIQLDHADQNLRNQIAMGFNTADELTSLIQADQAVGPEGGSDFKFGTPPALIYRETNLDAAADLASPDQDVRIVDQRYDTKWVEGDALIFGPETDPLVFEITADLAAGEWVTLRSGMLHAFCGTRSPGFTYALGTFEPDIPLDDDHLAYIRFDDEIISFDRCEVIGTFVDIAAPSPEYSDPLAMIGSDLTILPGCARFRIKERGVLGTTAAHHQGVKGVPNAPSNGPQLMFPASGGILAHDVTIPVAFVQAKIQRFSRGAPQITVRTHLDKYALQIGDIITLTTDQIGYYNHDGLTTADKWEITSKQVDLFGDEPCIAWKLVWAYVGDGDPIVDDKRITLGDRMIQRRTQDADHHVLKPTVVDHAIETAAGLDIEIGRGIVASSFGRILRPTVTIPLAPSSDNHVAINEITNQYTVTPVAVGDPAPTPAPGNVRIGVVTTDATDVINTDQTIRNVNETLQTSTVTTQATQGLIANRTFSSFSRG